MLTPVFPSVSSVIWEEELSNKEHSSLFILILRKVRLVSTGLSSSPLRLPLLILELLVYISAVKIGVMLTLRSFPRKGLQVWRPCPGSHSRCHPQRKALWMTQSYSLLLKIRNILSGTKNSTKNCIHPTSMYRTYNI